MSDSPQAGRRSAAGWGVLLIALCIESFLMVWVLLITVLAALGSSGSFGQDFSLVAMALICLVWIVITLVGTVRSKASWVRGSAVTIHVLLFAAGTGLLQFALHLFGWALIALACIGFVAAIVARPVNRPLEGDPASADSHAE